MQIDKKIDSPFGTVIFRGTLSEQEVDHLITLGLMAAVARGEIPVAFDESEEGSVDGEEVLLADTPQTLQ